MTDRLLPEMAEATRLTGLGKLMEATALIQRALWGGSSTSAGDSSDAEDTVAESEPPDEAAEPRSKTPHAYRPHASLKETVERVGAMTKSFEEGLHPGSEGAGRSLVHDGDLYERGWFAEIQTLRSRQAQ